MGVDVAQDHAITMRTMVDAMTMTIVMMRTTTAMTMLSRCG